MFTLHIKTKAVELFQISIKFVARSMAMTKFFCRGAGIDIEANCDSD